MWVRVLILGSAAAMGGLALAPAVAAGMARSGRAAVAAGLALNRAVARETLRLLSGAGGRLGAEAMAQLGDLVADARAAEAVRAGRADATGREAPVTVLAGPPGPVAPEPVVLHHAAGGRLRLGLLAGGARAGEAAALLADRIAGFPGVRRAVARPLARSVIVEAAGGEPAGALYARLARAGLVMPAPGSLPAPAAAVSAALLARLDLLLRLRSGGRADLRSVAAMLARAETVLRARAAAGDAAAARVLAALGLGD